MGNDMTTPAAGGDEDGFDAIARDSGNVPFLRHSAEAGWRDRDGIVPPQPVLAGRTDMWLRRWEDHFPKDIFKEPGKPLPNADDLNAEIPEAEWEIGLNGEKTPPWSRHYAVFLADPKTGETYLYCHNTFGAKIAVEELSRRVSTYRRFNDPRSVPLVNLSERPMKTRFGIKKRPVFETAGSHRRPKRRRFAPNRTNCLKRRRSQRRSRKIRSPPACGRSRSRRG